MLASAASHGAATPDHADLSLEQRFAL